VSRLAIEIAVLLASIFSMLFAGYQSFLLRQSLTTPFEANLQSRQIDVCGVFIRQAEIFISDVNNPFPSLLWKELKTLKGSKNSPNTPETEISPSDPNWPKSGNVYAFEYTSAEMVKNLIGALGEFRVYSSPSTVPMVDKAVILVSNVGSVSWEDTDTDRQKVASDAKQALLPLQDRCKTIMLGQEKGLL
jgi:hypothetical protein